MAEGKKSFIAYSDWHGVFKALPDDVAGKLIKHIFSYVNDENPSTDDFVINALFEQIKNTLKRDLNKWENERSQRSLAGKKSAENRATKSNDRSNPLNETERNPTVSVSVSVNDSVNDNVSDVLNKKETNILLSPSSQKFSFLNSLIEYGFRKELVSDWIQVRKTKKATNTQTAFNLFINELEKRNCDINKILELCIERSWGSFKWEYYDNINKQNNQNNGTERTNEQIFREALESDTGKNFRFS